MVRITDIDPCGRAAKAGVQAGDMLVSINGNEICDVLDYRFYLAERTVVLCEELAHATGTVGNILTDPRMERKAREQSFERLASPEALVEAYLCGSRETWEFAEHLGVTETFLAEAMANYRARYGIIKQVIFNGVKYAVTFEPILTIKKWGGAKGRRKESV